MASSRRGQLNYTLNLETGQFEKAATRVEKKFLGLTGKAASMAKTFTSGMGIGSGIAAFTALQNTLSNVTSAVISNNIEFERLTTQIKTLTVGGEEDIKRFNASLVQMASATATGPQELAKALFFVESAGIRGAAAMETTAAAAAAAKAGLGESAVIARTVVSAMTAYSDSHLGATEAVDKLIEIVRQGGAEATEYAGALGQVLPVAAALGVSFEEVGGFMAVFTRQGVSASEAGNALRGALLALTTPGTEAAKAMDALGFSSSRLTRMIRDEGLQATLAKLMEAFDGDLAAMKRVIPRVEALAGVLAVAGSQGEEYEKSVRAIADAHGNLAEVTEASLNTVGGQWDRLFAIIEAKTTASDSPIAKGTTTILKFYADIIAGADLTAIALEGLFGVAGRAVDRFLDLRAAAAGREDFFKELAGAGMSIGPADMTPFVGPTREMAEAQDDLWESSGLASDAAARLAEANTKTTKIIKEETVEIWKLGDAVMSLPAAVDLTATVFDNLGPHIAPVTAEVWKLGDAVMSLPAAVDLTATVFDTADFPGPIKAAKEETNSWKEALQGVMLMGGLIGGSFGQALQAVENIGQMFESGAWKEMTKNQKIGAVGNAVSMVGGVIGEKHRKIGGFLQGAGAGASMGSVAGPWGAAIGAVAGGIFGLIKGSKDPLADAAKEAGAVLGITISDEMAASFLEQSEATGQSVAEVAKQWFDDMKKALREEGMAQAMSGISLQVEALGGAPQYAEIAARNFNTVFWEEVKDKGLPAALDAFGEIFAKLREAFGDELPPGFQKLETLFGLMQDPAIKAQLQFAQGQAQFVSGATSAGFFDPSMTQDSVNIARDTLSNLRANGVDDKSANQMIAGLLRAELNASIVSGRGVDAGLQALLDEARANGVQILPDIAAQQLDVLKKIYQNLSGQTYTIPGGGGGSPVPPDGGGGRGGGEFPEERPRGYPPEKPWPPNERLAAGGIVTAPIRALIGEAGPEAVMPLGMLANIGPELAALRTELPRAVARAVRDGMIQAKGG